MGANDGKPLEGLVALIEKLHLPGGFKISTNDRVYDDNGNQIAEFDVIVEGRLGTTDVKWLIECRDRPSEGPAPCSWIEQLMGRRQRFKDLNKVTAVSTTGFAAGALALAKEGGIELREVHSLTQADVSSWLLMESMPSVQPHARLLHTVLYSADGEPEERSKLFDEIVRSRSNEAILWQTRHKESHTIPQAFQLALLEMKEAESKDVFAGVEHDAPPRPLILQVNYPNVDSCYLIRTELGEIRVRRIDFHGELSVTTKQVPLKRLSEYVRSDSGEPIAQSAAFEFSALGYQLSLEMHKLSASGETKLVIRNLGPATTEA